MRWTDWLTDWGGAPQSRKRDHCWAIFRHVLSRFARSKLFFPGPFETQLHYNWSNPETDASISLLQAVSGRKYREKLPLGMHEMIILRKLNRSHFTASIFLKLAKSWRKKRSSPEASDTPTAFKISSATLKLSTSWLLYLDDVETFVIGRKFRANRCLFSVKKCY